MILYKSNQKLKNQINDFENDVNNIVNTTPTIIQFDDEPTAESNNVVKSESILRYSKNYPYKEICKPIGSANSFTTLQIQNFLIDIELNFEKESNKKYSLISCQRNFGGVWQIRICKTDSDGSSNTFDILRFYTTVNPESRTKLHLSSYNNTKLDGWIIVDWSAIPNNSNFYSMTPFLGYELSEKIFKGYSPKYTSTSLKQNELILEENNYLSAQDIDKIIFPFYLKGASSTLDYGVFMLKNNYDDGNNGNTEVKNAFEIFSIDNSDTIELVAQYRTNEAVSGFQKIELKEANNSGLSGVLNINWDAIPTTIKYHLGTSVRAKGYIFKDSFFRNKSNDISTKIDSFDTIYDAFQKKQKGIINVGLTTLKSDIVPTSISDYKNINNNKKISQLFDNVYIDTQGARLLLIDKSKLMWWRLATNSGVQVFTCSLSEFKTNLVDMPTVNGETRKKIPDFAAGTSPAFFNLVNSENANNVLNITSLKTSLGNYVGQDDVANDEVGKLYFFNKSNNRFEESTLPSFGRQGFLRSAWGFDFYQNIVVTNGYHTARGKGRLLYSSDNGQTFTTIFDVALTTAFTESERVDAHIHGCYIDRYNNNRIYIVTGDYLQTSEAGKIFYTDNPQDASPTWVKVKINITETVSGNEQYVSMFGTEDNLLFGVDMRKNAITRQNRTGDSQSQREIAYLFSTLETGVTHATGSWSKYSHNDPIFCMNQTADLGNSPSTVIATFDGIQFFEVWEDTVNHNPFYNTQSIIHGFDGEFFMLFQEGSNNRFSSGMTLLMSKYETI